LIRIKNKKSLQMGNKCYGSSSEEGDIEAKSYKDTMPESFILNEKGLKEEEIINHMADFL
jgi:hypothetical protein